MKEVPIRHFIYIDKEYINSLYYQIPDIQIPSRIITKNSVLGSAKVGLLSSLSANAESTHEYESQYQIEVFPEHKVNTIISQIFGNEIQLLPDILSNPFAGNSKLIACLGLFRFNYAYDNEAKCYLTQGDIAANPLRQRDLAFVFASCSDYIDTFCPESYYIELLFSSSKMIRGVRHITNNIKYGTDFTFGILGEIVKCRKGFYSIKPGAIWRMTSRNLD